MPQERIFSHSQVCDIDMPSARTDASHWSLLQRTEKSQQKLMGHQGNLRWIFPVSENVVGRSWKLDGTSRSSKTTSNPNVNQAVWDALLHHPSELKGPNDWYTGGCDSRTNATCTKRAAVGRTSGLGDIERKINLLTLVGRLDVAYTTSLSSLVKNTHRYEQTV